MYEKWEKNESVQTLCLNDLVRFKVPEGLRYVKVGKLPCVVDLLFAETVEGQVTGTAKPGTPQKIVAITVVCVQTGNACFSKTFFVKSDQIIEVDYSHERRLF